MTDTFSRVKRRVIMQSVRRERTRPEDNLATLFRRLGLRFRRNVASLPGKPDFVFQKGALVVFMHGCFWHGHLRCHKGRSRPKTNAVYWLDKVVRNRARDRRVASQLRQRGYSVFTIWECDVKRGILPAKLRMRLAQLPIYEASSAHS